MEQTIEKLLEAELFEGLSNSDIESFLHNTAYTIRQYDKNDVFALAGNRVNHLMVVLEGTLIARMVSDSGKHIQIDKIDAGRVIAPAMLFATNNVFPVNVIPDTSTSVLFIHKDVFLKAIHQQEKMLFNFIRIVSDINSFLSTKIHSLSLKTIRGKLAEYFLQKLEEQGGKDIVKLDLTRQELADKFAISRQALSRSLSELEEEQLIKINGREIQIINKHGLRNEE